MTPPLSNAARVMLVPEPRSSSPSGPHAAKIRRYRLARLRLLERREAGPSAFGHLGRMYD